MKENTNCMFKALINGKWYSAQARKPLAVVVVLYVLVLGILSFAFQRDVPPGMVTILSFVVPTVVGGYFISSSVEKIKGDEK